MNDDDINWIYKNDPKITCEEREDFYDYKIGSYVHPTQKSITLDVVFSIPIYDKLSNRDKITVQSVMTSYLHQSRKDDFDEIAFTKTIEKHFLPLCKINDKVVNNDVLNSNEYSLFFLKIKAIYVHYLSAVAKMILKYI